MKKIILLAVITGSDEDAPHGSHGQPKRGETPKRIPTIRYNMEPRAGKPRLAARCDHPPLSH
jgi:hypothetical protein